MAYNKKTWLARLGQGLNKFILNGGSKVTLESSPDTVTQQGTPLSAENMNDLEDRIDSEFTNVNSAINAISSTVASKLGSLYLNPYDGKYLDLNDSRFLDWGRITTFGWDFGSCERVSNRPQSGSNAMSGFTIAFTDYAIQFAWDYLGNGIYYRTYYSSWNGWKQFTVNNV